MGYFFFSYANVDRSDYLKRFYADLCEEVRLLVGGPSTQAGFRDAISIEMGARWNDDIIRELMTCQVFVALYSPSYFKSEYCGKEWAAFSQRINSYANEEKIDPPSIIPVLWAPVPKMPEVAKSLQWKTEDFGKVYEEEGMSYLMRHLQRNKPEYYKIVRTLATRIREVGDEHCLPEPSEPFFFEKVATAFPITESAVTPVARKKRGAPVLPVARDSGPKHVNFVIVAGARNELAKVRKGVEGYGAVSFDWVPYYPADVRRIASFAQGVISRRDLTSNLETIDGGLAAVLDRAAENNELVIIVVDGWSALLSRYSAPLLDYDKRNEPSVIVMVPANKDDPEVVTPRADPVAAIKRALPRNVVRNDVLFNDQLLSIKDFQRALIKSVTLAQGRVFSTGKVPPQAFPPTGLSSPPQLTGP